MEVDIKPGDLVFDKTRDNMQGIIIEKDYLDIKGDLNVLPYDYLVLYSDGQVRPVDAYALRRNR